MTKQQPLLILIFVAMIVFIGWMYFLPLFDVVSVLRQDRAFGQDKLEEAEILKAQLTSLENKYGALAGQADALFELMPGEQDIPGLLTQMEDLTSKNGLILANISFSAVEDKTENDALAMNEAAESDSFEFNAARPPAKRAEKTVKKLAIDLSLSGEETSLENFLKSLENNLRLMDVSSIGFSVGEGSGAEESSGEEFNVSLHAYYME